MKVALLNLPLDNNYGGNLQRYALITALKKMGHDPVHISLRKNFKIPFMKIPLILIWRAYQRYIRKMSVDIFYEWKTAGTYNDGLKNIMPFYEEYIPHTAPIYNKTQLRKLERYDAYIVGSDQVWRKTYTGKMLECYFFSFLKQESPLLLAYAVSFGKNENEYIMKDVKRLKPLYERFKATSVREQSGLDILKSIGFTNPSPVSLLDPTFLLSRVDYMKLFDNRKIVQHSGSLFCYILDKNSIIDEEIKQIVSEHKLKPFYCNIKDNKMTIEQWLCCFSTSEYVVTDSYHGVVFSIIFNKPFSLIRNAKRGNARFDTLLDTFGLKDKNEEYDWDKINSIIESKRDDGIHFFKNNLV